MDQTAWGQGLGDGKVDRMGVRTFELSVELFLGTSVPIRRLVC